MSPLLFLILNGRRQEGSLSAGRGQDVQKAPGCARRRRDEGIKLKK